MASMQAAIDCVKCSGSSVRSAAREYEIPRKTLEKYVKLPDPVSEKQKLGRYDTVFSKQQQMELVNHVLKLERSCYGINAMDFRSLAFELAERNKIDYPFDRKPVEIGFTASDNAILN